MRKYLTRESAVGTGIPALIFCLAPVLAGEAPPELTGAGPAGDVAGKRRLP